MTRALKFHTVIGAYILFFLFNSAPSIQAKEKQPIKLTDSQELLKKINPLLCSYVEIIAHMMHVRKNLIEILYGKEIKSISRGNYIIDGTRYTLDELHQLEPLAPGEQTHSRISNNNLTRCLTQAKTDTFKASIPFLNLLTHDMREILPGIIQEWAKKRGRHESFLLLGWQKDPAANVSIFNEHVSSYAQLHRWCEDLKDFIDVFCRNLHDENDSIVSSDS